MAAAHQKMDAAFEFFAKLGVPFYCFHDRDIAPEGATFKESAALLDEMVDAAAEPPGAHRRRAAVGHRQPVLQPALPGRRGDQPRPRGVRLRRRRRSPTASTRPTASAATTTCCGAGGRATRRCSTPTCAASSTSSAGSCTMVVEHKHRIGFTGTILHRAEAVRADQAPVRLRRRRRVRVPPALRPGRRDQGQHRGQPRHARRPRLRPRDRRRSRRRHLRLDRRQRRRRPPRLGRRPLPGVGRADDARHARDPPRRRVQHAAASTSTPSCAASRSTATDLFHAHIGGMDTMARALLAAASILESGELDAARDRPLRRLGRRARPLDPRRHAPRCRRCTSGRRHRRAGARCPGGQERLENLVARHVARVR